MAAEINAVLGGAKHLCSIQGGVWLTGDQWLPKLTQGFIGEITCEEHQTQASTRLAIPSWVKAVMHVALPL